MNEIVKIDQPSADVRAYRASTEAADICKDIVIACSSTIQGRRFVSVEGWSAIAVAHGCALSARDVEKIDGGVRAIGEVRRMSDGQLIATGEGFVGEDETTWFGGTDKRGKKHDRRNDYAIRAMAQTRAMSRAGRTAFAHVVVMMKAGLATTPAEEVAYADAETGEIIDFPSRSEPVPGISKIKQRLNKFMTEGNASTELDAFLALKRANKDDLKSIRDAGHSYWTGDGEDFEGFEAWMKRRVEELTPAQETIAYQLLVSTLNELQTMSQYQSWIGKNGDVVDALDGVEGRKFEQIHEAKVAELRSAEDKGQPTPLTEGAFGG